MEVAAGTAIADRPPHRSVRALLTHTALIGMFGVKLRLPAANRPNFAPLHDPHERLNEPARLRCPIYSDFATACHWSVNPCEYAADVVFRRQAGLQAIYRNLTLTAIRSGLFQAPPRGRTPDGFQPALPGGSAFLRLQPARPPTMKIRCAPSFAGSSISAGCKTKPSVAMRRKSTALRYHAHGSDCGARRLIGKCYVTSVGKHRPSACRRRRTVTSFSRRKTSEYYERFYGSRAARNPIIRCD